ncbi:hypothetical protein NADFUDRAFT_49418 [Nadsonia fulvescens var. elongata DSM 6958]|uniref:Uncharacterized protein n=1 Tax=Nadsonia fulvescens var. elongata DSM 6958 TaxID=857566 RepID=A0A1E3PNG9_9ASCO|nr:hypothetical protein NADFUDRAFT_49418 [Nadsonia fulvescens var. elongata DSM 6958]
MIKRTLNLLDTLITPVNLTNEVSRTRVYQLQDEMLHYTEARRVISVLENNKNVNKFLIADFLQVYLQNETASQHVAESVLKWYNNSTETDRKNGEVVYRRLSPECLQAKATLLDLEIEFIWQFTVNESSNNYKWKLARVQLVSNQNDDFYWKNWFESVEEAESDYRASSVSSVSSASLASSASSVSSVSDSSVPSPQRRRSQNRHQPRQRKRLPVISDISRKIIHDLRANRQPNFGAIGHNPSANNDANNQTAGWNHLLTENALYREDSPESLYENTTIRDTSDRMKKHEDEPNNDDNYWDAYDDSFDTV